MNARRVVKPPGSLDPPPVRQPSEVAKTLARNVRIARHDAGLTQRELAELAQLSTRVIWEIEDKYRNINLSTLTTLARALGKTEAQLLTPLPWSPED